METQNLTRREFVGGMAVGLAAASTGRAVAAAGDVTSGTAGAAGADRAGGPTEAGELVTTPGPDRGYPKPPFPAQEQPWPGLARDMKPKPDHGEKSYKGSGRLKGRKALVTGGDSGIGRAAAIAFAREGADVAINCLPAEEPDAQEVVELIKAEGRKAVAIPGDIKDEAFCKELVEKAVKELGGLDIVVNNAARQQQRQSLLELTSEDFDATFKTNVYAPFWITRAALPHLKSGATIINTASEQAYDPSKNLVDYAQTKACMVSFTKSMAKQLVEKGIRVNAVAPGPYWTPLQVSGGATQEDLQNFGSKAPMGRPGQPAELGPVYVLLASNESSYATGQVYGASGGNGQP